jgi:peroxiredoxin
MLVPAFEKMGLQNVSDPHYAAEDGTPLDEQQFFAQVHAGKSFSVAKKPGAEGALDVTVRLGIWSSLDSRLGKLKAGESFPEFDLADLDGKRTNNKMFEGSYTLISFYYAACAPCVHEVPLLNALAQQRKDINMVAMTYDADDVSREFVAKHGLAWRVVPNADKVTTAIGVRAYPTLALVDPQGKLVKTSLGESDLATLNHWLDQGMGRTRALPESIVALLKSYGEEKYSSVSFYDEAGKEIDAATFAEQMKAGRKFGAGKKRRDGADPAIELRIMSAEALAEAARPPSKIKPGEAFPEFHLARLDGSAIDNHSLNGRYTLVSFYFAQCSPCVKEVPTLNALADRRKDMNLLAVTFDSVEESKLFVGAHHLNWTIVPDARKLTDDAGVKGYPLFALLDRDGKLVEMAYPNAILEAHGTFDAWLDKKLAAPD